MSGAGSTGRLYRAGWSHQADGSVVEREDETQERNHQAAAVMVLLFRIHACTSLVPPCGGDVNERDGRDRPFSAEVRGLVGAGSRDAHKGGPCPRAIPRPAVGER